MFANMRLNFQGDHMPLLAIMLPPARATITGESLGEAAPSNPQTVPETITEPDHSHDHESTPPRPTTTTSSGPVNEQGPSSDPNIASSSRLHESAPDLFTSTNVEDETMGGSFHTSPPRSTQAPPAVNTQESEFKAHKLLLNEVVGKLLKKVKLLEDKFKVRKRKFVMTDSDKEEDAEEDVDSLIKLAKTAATATAASAVPTGGSHEADIPPSSSIPSDEFAGGSAVLAGATTGPSADPSNKGKSPLLEEDPPVKERTFRQREEDRLGEEAARRMYEEEQADLEREREEMQRKRQQDVLNSTKYYTDSDWNDIMSQDKRNKPMTYAQQKAYMRTFVKNQSSTIYTTGWTMKHVKSFSDDQLKTEFDKIRATVAELKSLNIKRSLKRPSANLEQPSSKKSKPTDDPQSSVLDESQQPSIEVPSQKATTEDVSSFLPLLLQHNKLLPQPRRLVPGGSDFGFRKDSDSDDDTPVNLHGVVDWELLPTGLGWVNVIYKKDQFSQCFSGLRESFPGDCLEEQNTWIIHKLEAIVFYGINVLETVRVGLVLHMFVVKSSVDCLSQETNFDFKGPRIASPQAIRLCGKGLIKSVDGCQVTQNLDGIIAMFLELENVLVQVGTGSDVAVQSSGDITKRSSGLLEVNYVKLSFRGESKTVSAGS
ncbi:hypothetical protein Tco_1062833 [Tanacetum coccineum]